MTQIPAPVNARAARGMCAVGFSGLFGGRRMVVVELEPEGKAMAQLKERRYADEYRHLGQPIHLIAVEFSKDARNVASFEVERAA